MKQFGLKFEGYFIARSGKKKAFKMKAEISTISERTLKRLQLAVIKIGHVWKQL